MSHSNSQIEEVGALARRFLDMVSDAPTHSIGLNALLQAFASVAVSHPCCTHNAGQKAYEIGVFLMDRAREQGPIHANHIH